MITVMWAMIILLASAWSTPSEVELRRGMDLASVDRTDIWRRANGQRAPRAHVLETTWPDRVAIGSWSDGVVKRAVEFATPLTPDLWSRWLGFLSGRDALSVDEVRERWSRIAAAQEGERWILVELAAYPKTDLLEGDGAAPAKTEEIVDVDFVVQSGRRAAPVLWRRIAYVRARRRGDAERFAWWRLLPSGHELEPRFEPTATPGATSLGGFHRAYYWLRLPAEVSGRVDLSVLSAHKTRRALLDLGD